ncbi:MAG: ferritin-like domain-containing protein [Thermodesulfobacteriota bacterium]
MAGIFQVNEVVSVAVEIEKKGEAFYRDMAQRAKSPRVKEALEFLAAEEVKHQRVFSQMLSRMAPLQPPAGSLEADYWAYVNDLIDSHFLFDAPQAKKILSSVASDKEALHLAMGFEKESILFFTEMKALVPAEEAGGVEACIQEERKHLRKLAQLIKAAP